MSDTVIIVDDSLTVRMDLVEAFTAAGFKTLPCASVAEARQALGCGPASIVVLDVLLPDGDGVELLREIRASPAGTATIVIMLSTEADVKDRIRGLQTGADEYVGKPYESGYVVAMSTADRQSPLVGVLVAERYRIEEKIARGGATFFSGAA